MAVKSKPFEFLGAQVAPGHRQQFELPVGQLYTQTDVSIPVEVVHGRSKGPRLLICAAIHGDELNGVEIVRRVLHAPWLKNLKGTLVAVPIVNVLGTIHRSRYLPDRRDLNRSFPGSEKGSLAARMAHLFTTRILQQADYAIDLHTGAIDRSNLPQIRVHLDNQKAAELAHMFGVPVIIDAEIRDGSFRGAGDDLGVPIITYEAGEALRFDENSIAAGVRGVRRVMEELGMIKMRVKGRAQATPVVARSSQWVRAPVGGFLRVLKPLGSRVNKGDLLGYLNGPLDSQGEPILSPCSGIVIGRSNLPLAHEGEAIFHIARFNQVDLAEQVVETFHSDMEDHISRSEAPIT
ncbi:predicted deacylase [Hahella chejuensis KCTC 2396]|uniref:Predicted deacylase n=1 Tax=Hahella chejuensis (strain KCTC 2396) TaxID=349521 RepID=Q2SPJ1_HAHCH|nr:succinylglutamate desuccinylase/aspartoacylase family protein [Hahella chejuensis]ABC27433.1 predicted deacylase [Hahella chejuensis KCTC 2396]